MHESCIVAVKRFRDSYVTPGMSLLDVGGHADCNCRHLFKDTRYLTLNPYGNADIIVKDPYQWDEVVEKFDVVLSTNTLEHVAKFWLVLKNMGCLAKSGGLICVIVPSIGPVHDKMPVDCYRFLPDCCEVFAELVGASVIECDHNQSSSWGDLTVIMKKT